MDRKALDPTKRFFIKVSDSSLDGRLDLDAEMPSPFETLDEAVKEAQEEAKEFRQEAYIYECIPTRRVHFGKPKVTKMSVNEKETP